MATRGGTEDAVSATKYILDETKKNYKEGVSGMENFDEKVRIAWPYTHVFFDDELFPWLAENHGAVTLPDLLGFFPILTPMAATGLALTMSGASVVHLKRDEFEMILVNLFLMFISAGIGFYRLLEM